MKIIRISDLLLETNLSKDELNKVRGGKLRGQVFVDKIKEDPIVTINTDTKTSKGTDREVEITNVDEILSMITNSKGEYDTDKSDDFFMSGRNYAPVIEVDEDGEENTYKLNNIKKTDEFGSSKGSSLGTKATKDVEELQCIILAYRQYKGSITDFIEGEVNDEIDELDDEVVTEDELDYLDDNDDVKNAIRSHLQITGNISDLKFSNYPNYTSSFLEITNSLFNDFYESDEEDNDSEVNEFDEHGDYIDTDKVLISPSRLYIFAHNNYNGGIPALFKKKYLELRKLEGISIDISKFTPADIWAIAENKINYISTAISSCKSVQELSDQLTNLFNMEYLYGISLKKLGDKSRMIVNKEESRPRFKLDQIKISKKLNSNSIYLKCNVFVGRHEVKPPLEMTLRNFGGKDMSAEVGGNKSRQGKININDINKYLSEYSETKKDKIFSYYEVTALIDNEEWTIEELVDECNEIAAKFGDRSEYTTSEIVDSPNGEAKLISRWQGLYFCWIIDKITNKVVQSNLLTKIFLHAMSVKTYAFESPKYVRFI